MRTESYESPSDATVVDQKPRHKLSLVLKIIIIILALGAIGIGGYLGVSTYAMLKDENAHLNDELSTYKDKYANKLVQVEISDEEMKNRLLEECQGEITDPIWEETCKKLKSGTEEEIRQIIDQYASATIKQTNLALDDNWDPIPGKYVGGKYAPYWLLHGLNITIPDSVMMERTVSVWSDGILGKFDSEGIAGCGGTGIFMNVTTDIVSSKKTFTARAYAQSYDSVPGCGGADWVYIPYAKYETLPNYPDKTFMEIVTYQCTDLNNYDDADKKACANGKYNSKEWTLYSGIISTSDAFSINTGAVTYPSRLDELTAVNDAKNFNFNIYCNRKNDEYSFLFYRTNSCNPDLSTYDKILAHSEYKELKNIIFTLQKN